MAPAPEPSLFQVAWICPMLHEAAPARAAFSTTYDDDSDYYKARFGIDRRSDWNTYFFGTIYGFDVVVCVPHSPNAGQGAALSACESLSAQFGGIQYLFLVGLAGGKPYPDHEPDIRCGDVVIGMPDKGHSGIIDLDDGRQKDNEIPTETAVLRGPHRDLKHCAQRVIERLEIPMNEYAISFREMASELRKKMPEDVKLPTAVGWESPTQTQDVCFRADYSCESTPEQYQSSKDWCPTHCRNRDKRITDLPKRKHGLHKVHGGLIASSNKVIQSAKFRDKQAKAIYSERNRGIVLAFETEGAAVARERECLHVRGICDYADSHKTKVWQGHAAIQAVVVAKIILLDLRDMYSMSLVRAGSFSTFNSGGENLSRTRTYSNNISHGSQTMWSQVSWSPNSSSFEGARLGGHQNRRRNTDLSQTTDQGNHLPYRPLLRLTDLDTRHGIGLPDETEQSEEKGKGRNTVNDHKYQNRQHQQYREQQQGGRANEDRDVDDEQEQVENGILRQNSSASAAITLDDSPLSASNPFDIRQRRFGSSQAYSEGENKGKMPVRADPLEDVEPPSAKTPGVADLPLPKPYLMGKPIPTFDSFNRCRFRVRIIDVDDRSYVSESLEHEYPVDRTLMIEGFWSIEHLPELSSSDSTGCFSKMLFLQADSNRYCLQFWIPPDNVSFKKEIDENEDQYVFKWSNCKAYILQRRQGKDTVYRCYKPGDPNIRLQIALHDEQVARRFHAAMVDPNLNESLWRPYESTSRIESGGNQMILYRSSEFAMSKGLLVDTIRCDEAIETHHFFRVTRGSKMIAKLESSSSSLYIVIEPVQILDYTTTKSDKPNGGKHYQHPVAGRPKTEHWINRDSEIVPHGKARHEERTLKVDLLRASAILTVFLSGERISLGKARMRLPSKYKLTKSVILLHKIDNEQLICLCHEDMQWYSIRVNKSTIRYEEQTFKSKVNAWKTTPELPLDHLALTQVKGQEVAIKFDSIEDFQTCKRLLRTGSW